MDYQGFTDDSLVKLYEGVQEALAADEVLGGEGRFRVRKTPAWKLHAADLEAEMLRRRMTFEVIDWYEANPPVEEMHALPAVPEQSPPQVEPSRSQSVLATLSAIDVLNFSPVSSAKKKPPKKRPTKARLGVSRG